MDVIEPYRCKHGCERDQLVDEAFHLRKALEEIQHMPHFKPISDAQEIAAKALSRPEAGGKEAAGEGEGRISAVREKLRLRMLEQPISEERNTYSDGYAGGLMDAIGMLDEALQSLPARPGGDRVAIAKAIAAVEYGDGNSEPHEPFLAHADAIMALIEEIRS